MRLTQKRGSTRHAEARRESIRAINGPGDVDTSRASDPKGTLRMAARARVIQRVTQKAEIEAQHGQPKALVAAGHWNVSVTERPDGWEKWGIPE